MNKKERIMKRAKSTSFIIFTIRRPRASITENPLFLSEGGVAGSERFIKPAIAPIIAAIKNGRLVPSKGLCRILIKA
jgi:hypothetical protein